MNTASRAIEASLNGISRYSTQIHEYAGKNPFSMFAYASEKDGKKAKSSIMVSTTHQYLLVHN